MNNRDLQRVNDPEHAALKVWTGDTIKVVKEYEYRRFTLRHIAQDLLDAFMLHKGILLTIKELTLRPGRVVRGFLDCDRERYTHPIRYFLLLAGAYVLMVLAFGLYEAEMAANFSGGESAELVTSFMSQYFFRYLNIWMGLSTILFGFLSYFLWRKNGFNYVEHIIANLYLFAQIIVFSFPLELLHVHASPVVFYSAYLLMWVAYSVWFMRDLFGRSWISTLWKTFVYITVGSIVFNLFIGILAATAAIVFLKN